MDIIGKLGAVVAVLTFTVVPLHAQKSGGAYDYPIKPGTSEWKALTSHDQMQKVCQIPDATLKNMSTTDLVETCVNYPLYGDIFAFDEFQKGFESVTSGFNGLQELLKRSDAGTKLIEKYNGMDPEAFGPNWSLVKKGEYAAKFYSLEILLAQEQILANLQKNQAMSLVRDCIRKAQAKSKYPEVYGVMSFGNLALVAGRIMLRENLAQFRQKVSADDRMRTFLQDASVPSASVVDTILDHASQYVNGN